MITVTGVDWAVTRKLAAALGEAPENGRFVFGVRGHSNLEQLRRFRTAGVSCPDFTTSYPEVQAWIAAGATVFGRKAEHTQGSDIIIAFPDGRFDPNWPIHFRTRRDYWTKVIPNVLQEWRIHIFDSASIARGLKRNEDDNSEGLIKNRGYDYRMVHNVEPPRGLRRLAKDACAALGYPYGAVDLLHCQNANYVLEVNTAPAMDNYTRSAYVSAIKRRFAPARG